VPEYSWAIALVAVFVVVILLVRAGRAAREREAGSGVVKPGGRADAPKPKARAGSPMPKRPGAGAEPEAAKSYEGVVRSAGLRAAAAEAGWERPPTAHGRALPPIVAGEDVVLVTKSGPVRSAAYLLAALDRPSDGDGLETLILCTDRRHAARVAAQARQLARSGDVWVGEIHEEGDEETQLRDLRAGFDLVVATPGRLNRHLRNGAPVMTDVRLIVVDDAGKILGRADLARRLERVLQEAPAGRQMILVADESSPRLREKAAALVPSARWVEVADEGESAAAESAAAAEPVLSHDAGSPAAEGSPGPDGRVSGVVKWFNDSKGYGFLLPDGGDDDVFVHYSAIAGDGFRSLEEGARVRFTIVDTQKGPEATDVEPL
jgi:cold shock CspA family protein